MVVNWRKLGRWVFGESTATRLRLVEEVRLPPGLFACIPLAGELGEVRAELVLSDRFGPREIRRIVEFATRRDLPVDGWVVRGIGALPFRWETTSRWLAGVANAARPGTVITSLRGLPPASAERMAAHLRTLHDAVDVSYEPSR